MLRLLVEPTGVFLVVHRESIEEKSFCHKPLEQSIRLHLRTAIRILKEAVSREPDSNLSRIWLVNALIESRMIKEAEITAIEILKIESEFLSSRWVDSAVFKSTAMVP